MSVSRLAQPCSNSYDASMSNPLNSKFQQSSVRQPVLLGLFVGTAVGAGYLLAAVPNVELMTLVIALCGGVMGAVPGFVAGAIAAVIFSLGSPYGLAVPQMLAAQGLGLGFAGIGGAIGGRIILRAQRNKLRLGVLFASVATAVLSTFVFDLLTNLAIIWAFDTQPLLILSGAIPFALLHMGSNAVIFATLFPVTLPRLRGLRRAALVERTGPLILALVCLTVLSSQSFAQEDLAEAVADTNETEPLLEATPLSETETSPREASAVSGPEAAFGWQRGLWTPFARTGLEWLTWHSNLLPIIDGGLGAPVIVLGETSTSQQPLVWRDGLLNGTGHIMADSPWLTPIAGLELDKLADGADGWGGTGGVVALKTYDPDPQKAVSSYQGARGNHEMYQRSIRLLTPKAAWRAAFEFEENLDIEGYNYSELDDQDFLNASENPFPGHSRIRQSRTRLFRELDADNSFEVEYSNARLTKDALPVYGAEHLEIWDDAVGARARSAHGAWRLNSAFFWRSRDVIWGDRSDVAVVGENTRKLETSREGIDFKFYRHTENEPHTGFEIQASKWYVDDTFTDEAWLTNFAGTGQGEGETVRFAAKTGRTGSSLTWQGAVGGNWHSYAGTGFEAGVQAGAAGDQPLWTVSAQYGGRAPRSDELVTPLRRVIGTRVLVLAPNEALERERTLRLALSLETRVLGFGLAVDGSVIRLENGITWRESPGTSNSGQWFNDLRMDSQRLTASVSRDGRFLGWARLKLEGTWQESDEKAGRAAFLPPQKYLRAQVMWENHFFNEDGILQLVLYSTLQGEMADPWDVTRTAQLPSRTVHDLLLGFRLVGAHISFGIRNLTGERTRLTSGALSTGQEIDLRLHWAWVY